MGTRAARIPNFPVGLTNGNNHSETHRFGVFEINLRAGELRRNGVKIKLQEQPFQVLVLLLERPGEVVTREEVRNRLWPADTFVDFDHSLNAAVRRLRDALGDSAENPTFVETVARRGYRFLAPVSTVPMNDNGTVVSIPAPAAPAVTSPRIRRGWIIAALAAVVLVVIGVVLGFLLASRDLAPSRVTPLTANPVDDPVITSSVSRDGRYMAFSDDTGFYLRQIDTGETHVISLPEGLLPNSITWFPDNVHMVLGLCAINRESSLWEVSALGGSARKLVDDGAYPAVSPDGKQMAFIVGKPMRQRIWLAAIDGEQPREVAGTDGDLFGRIGWSPDGQRIAYTTARFTYGYGAKGKIAVLDVRAPLAGHPVPQPAIVLAQFGLEAPLAWASDGRLIYTQAESRPRQEDSNLWWIRLNHQMRPSGPVRLTSDAGSVLDVSASAQNNRIVYTKGVPEPDVYVGELKPSGVLSEPQRLTLDDRKDLPFDWTTDNKEVIFSSDRTGTFDIYKQDIHKTVPDVLVSGNQNVVEPRLSPDGSQILYLVNPSWGDPNFEVPLMRVPLAGGTPQQIARAKWISNHQCARAPAAVCIYSVLDDSALTFFRFDPMGGGAAQVFQLKDETPQLFNWSLSPDGTTLAIAKGKNSEDEPRIHLVSLSGGPERWLTVQGSPGVSSLDWAADSKSLWAATSTEKENALLRIDLQGTAHVVWRPQKGSVGWAIPSRDGKYLALHVRSSTANVWMLER
jgi:DNA-binding winged helix-turn-helix (wHTH) protein/Tol biopolymer transport system component